MNKNKHEPPDLFTFLLKITKLWDNFARHCIINEINKCCISHEKTEASEFLRKGSEFAAPNKRVRFPKRIKSTEKIGSSEFLGKNSYHKKSELRILIRTIK